MKRRIIEFCWSIGPIHLVVFSLNSCDSCIFLRFLEVRWSVSKWKLCLEAVSTSNMTQLYFFQVSNTLSSVSRSHATLVNCVCRGHVSIDFISNSISLVHRICISGAQLTLPPWQSSPSPDTKISTANFKLCCETPSCSFLTRSVPFSTFSSPLRVFVIGNELTPINRHTPAVQKMS